MRELLQDAGVNLYALGDLHALACLTALGIKCSSWPHAAGEPLMTEETIEHMAAVVEVKGTDAFWQLPVEDLLPERLRAEAPKLRKQLETMDVWFDSGTSWAGCVESTAGLAFPADLYLEVNKMRRACMHCLLPYLLSLLNLTHLS